MEYINVIFHRFYQKVSFNHRDDGEFNICSNINILLLVDKLSDNN